MKNIVILQISLIPGLSCSICHSAEDARCRDPFYFLAENGDRIFRNDFLQDCDDRAVRIEQGIPDDKTAHGCKKIVETGKNYIMINT